MSTIIDSNRIQPRVQVVIEVPRGGFVKRGPSGKVDFVSPLPCPFNYGSIQNYRGLEGDYLDAVVLGPRLKPGTRVTMQAFGAVGLTDRSLYDDKIICSAHPVSARQRLLILGFFAAYAKCKVLLNWWRGHSGRHACEGWGPAQDAIARARLIQG